MSHPANLLYATSARLAGTGLDNTSHNGALASYRAGYLGKAVAYGNHQSEIPAERLRLLGWHPVRLLANLGSAPYYAAKKRYLDWIASRMLDRGEYDCFHGWAGESARSLIAARSRGIPSLIDVATWHRGKGGKKRFASVTERTALQSGLVEKKSWVESLEIPRLRAHLEYELADVILVASEKARETFLDAGVTDRKLFYLARGVDAEQYHPAAAPPPKFRFGFVGALILRKGVHHLLEAWHCLQLKDAELVLVGSCHDEIKPYLQKYTSPSVIVKGFSSSVAEELRGFTAFVFPSTCEGSAKTTYEAAATGLAQITTRESGDIVVNGENGLVVPANDVNALCEAMLHFYKHPEKLPEMGRKGRERILQNFTWDHYRERLVNAYKYAHDRARR